MTQARALLMDPNDNVAVCTTPVHAGDEVQIIHPDGKRGTIRAAADIAFCNKIALRDIRCGEDIIKYGESIGLASADIACATLANDSNIVSQPRRYADEYILGKEAAK